MTKKVDGWTLVEDLPLYFRLGDDPLESWGTEPLNCCCRASLDKCVPHLSTNINEETRCSLVWAGLFEQRLLTHISSKKAQMSSNSLTHFSEKHQHLKS